MPTIIRTWRFFRSLRARLLLLVLLCTLPAFGIVFYDTWSESNNLIGQAHEELRARAHRAASELDGMIRGTELLVRSLARMPEIRTLETPACSRLLAELIAPLKRYPNVSVSRPDGELVCSALPFAGRVNYADRDYFSRALASTGIVISMPVFGRVTGKTLLPMTYAIRDGALRVIAVVTIALDLERFAVLEALGWDQPGTVFALWDREARLLFWWPDPERWIGRQFDDKPSGAILLAQPHGAFSAPSTDGVERVIGFSRLDETGELGLKLSLSVPSAILLAALLGGLMLLALAAAWLTGEVLIRRRVTKLTDTAERFGAGDFGARVGAPYETDEIGNLARVLDQTADALSRMTAGLEQRVAERTAQLAEASAVKSRFLANMSHELRTPLNAIIGFLELMRDGLTGALNPQQKDFVTDICAGGKHLLALINDVLDLSKVEAGMMTLQAERMNMDAVFASSLSMIKEKAMAHHLRLDREIDPALGGFSADLRKVKQIVFNLASNALKFTPDGGAITLGARKVPRDEVRVPAALPGKIAGTPAPDAGWFCEITVADTGVGISAEHLERLFQPFMQVDSSLSRTAQGTGLGLSLVKSLAELHGGCVGVASEPGKGSTFFVWLPLGESMQVAATSLTPGPSPGGRGEITADTPLALVIEDDDKAAHLIGQQLRADGFRTIRAATAEEGLVRAGKEHPDLITLDIFLPSMDGWEFLRRLKATSQTADIPVVIISVANDLEHGIALGAKQVLQKPYTRERLAGALAAMGFGGDQAGTATVLVVDDNPRMVELLDVSLAAQKFKVLHAYGGREAIEMARRHVPELILLDLMMPGVTGFDVVEALKRDAATAAIPILVVTAKDITPEDRAALNGNVLQIMQKSRFDPAQLSAEVRRALRHGRTAA